jgi:RNA polymerase sigma-70 factor (ECF subfamily)
MLAMVYGHVEFTWAFAADTPTRPNTAATNKLFLPNMGFSFLPKLSPALRHSKAENRTASEAAIYARISRVEASRSVSELLIAWGRGERAALEQLTPRVYGELRKLARIYLRRGSSGRSLQPTALINEAFLRLLNQSPPVQWESRAHFFGIAARLMRLILVDHARASHALKRGGAAVGITLDDCTAVSPRRAPDVLEINEALDRLAAVDERKAKVIEMRYFGGMDREEVAAALGLTVPTVKRDLRLGEAWLRRFFAGEKG